MTKQTASYNYTYL